MAGLRRTTALRAVTAGAAKRLAEKPKSTSNVLQFPVDEAARGRLAFEQTRLHVEALERELQTLAEEWHWTSAELGQARGVPSVEGRSASAITWR